MHNPYRLYEFLPPKAITRKESGDWQLLPGIMDSVHYLAEIVASKEIIEKDTPWNTRFHQHSGKGGVAEIGSDPEAASESYMTHLGSTACEGRRTFEFDRPLFNSPTGASNFRLEIEAPENRTREYYKHTLTAYSPLSPMPESPSTPFDEDEYQHMKELFASGQFEAWELHQAEKRTKTVKGVEPLPTIPYQDINSQFVFQNTQNGEGRVRRIYTATFRADSAHNALARVLTPINADHVQLETAYNPDALPRLTRGQEMVRGHTGAHSLVHHNLSLVLRHLSGDLPG